MYLQKNLETCQNNITFSLNIQKINKQEQLQQTKETNIK